ncbi:hypothetical protein PHLCEN_2v6433 [Hermanssonia centrifuga]|uniref:Carboxyltransferase domain-containing protein n=1 Tax=Hermanssonia centrifuga TaxID=98765 RepID=A0A2R6NZF2_9APHY|nr:hypothetical protein PHLCEN_2v6433 [Hermanssonia centrifuga]
MDSKRPKVVFRERSFHKAGDSAILVEYGDLILDFELRARIHAFETELQRRDVPGIWTTSPCIRSTMVRYNPLAISQTDLLEALVSVENLLPASMQDMTFPGRKIIFPIVLDDRWNRDALERYSRSIRDEAVYLPSNIEYLARNNGLSGGAEEALTLLVNTEWLVFGVGFYLACPFLIPIDPRCRLVGQKMNPSRTYTPRGALGIAGLVAAIYPIESPGGYQLFGRTLSPWQTWGRGTNFNPEQPWLLFPFDQLKFKVITEDEYIEVEKQFDSGRYNFEIEPTTFDMAQYKTFISSMEGDIRQFKSRQAGGVINEEAREVELMRSWEGKRQAAKENIAEVIALKENITESTNAFTVKSSMSAVVWKIKCSPGDIINSSEDVLMILEAMKTEINVEAGEENVGRRVQEFGRDVKPGAVVHAGDTLVVLE